MDIKRMSNEDLLDDFEYFVKVENIEGNKEILPLKDMRTEILRRMSSDKPAEFK